MIGGSSEIQKVFELIHKLSKVDTSVLIRGESGTGKELVARAHIRTRNVKKIPLLLSTVLQFPRALLKVSCWT